MKVLLSCVLFLSIACAVPPTTVFAQETPARLLDVAQFIKALREEPKLVEVELERTIVKPARPGVLWLPCLSDDLSRVAAVFTDNFIYVWDTKTGERVSPLNYHCPGRVTALALSADGKQILLGRQQGNALLSASDAEQVPTVFKGLTDEVQTAVLSLDGKYALLGQKNGDLLRYPIGGGEPYRVPRVDPLHRLDVLAISPAGQHALVGGALTEDRSVLQLDFTTFPEEGQEHTTAAIPYRFHASAGVIGSKYLIYNDSHDIVFRSRPDQRAGYISQSSWAQVYWMALAADERRLISITPEGILEVRDMMAPGIRVRVNLQQKVIACAIGSDGRTLALIDDQRTLVLKRLPETMEPPQLHCSRTLQQLLGAKDYEGLEAIFQHFEKDMTPFAWAPNHTPYHELCTLLATPPGAPLKFEKIHEAIVAWSAARPQAIAPQLLLAEEQIRQAWQKRGGGSADTVTAEGWREFKRHINAAEKLIVPVCEAPAPAPHAFSLLFTVAMAKQWSRERTEPYVEKLLSVAPHCLEAHFALALSYLPRWGGAPEDLPTYAAKLGDLVGGDEGDGLYARFAISQHFLHPAGGLFAGTGLDYERTQRGLAHLDKEAPGRKFIECFGAWFAVNNTDNERLKQWCDKLKDDDLTLVWPDEIARHEGDRRVVSRQIEALKQPAPAAP